MKFLSWLAGSPLGSAFKVAASAALVWALDNVASFNLSPVAQVALIAALPVLINAVNPQDGRYGVGKTLVEFDED